LKKSKVVLVIDGPDPDNYAALLAALSATMCYELVAVIMTGRPVSTVPKAKPYELNPHASRAVRRDNALHAKGILMRHGGERVPVFSGGLAPYSTVPHDLHIHERVTDVFDDSHAGHELKGDITDAVVYLASFDETIHVICGGPLTDVAYLMRHPMLMHKLGVAVAQLGMFGINPDVKVLAGGRRQFNALADPAAARDVLLHYAGPFYFIPTDVTKAPELAFGGADEIAALSDSSAAQELTAMYRQAWPVMWGGRTPSIPAHLHDIHPAVFMDQLLRDVPMHHLRYSRDGHDRIGHYTVSPVGIAHVPHLPHEEDRWGEIDLGEADDNQPPRFLVDGFANEQFRPLLAEILNTITTSSPLPALV